jgi:type I restriction enzyme, S subunit
MTQDQPPARWQKTPLGEVVTLQRGKDLPEHDRKQGPFPVVGSNGIVGYHAESVARGPGVLVGRSGSVGKVTWVEGDYWPLNTSLWVTDFHSNHPEFIFHFLTHLDLGKHTAGVSVPTLNRNVLHPLHVSVPPHSEQRAIARALRAVQDAREARQRELTLERERKAALMQQLFTRGARGESTKQTEIGEMPESWSLVRIEDVTLALGSGLTPRGGDTTYLRAGIPLIRSQNVLMSRLSLDGVAFISRETHKDMSRSAVQPNDVLLNITGASIGRVAVVPGSVIEANVNQHVCRIRFDHSVEPNFVAYYLSTPQGQAHIMGSQFGTTRQGLNYGNVRSLRIPLPPLPEQQRISSVLSACDAKLLALARETVVLDELFRALLEELMTGRLSVAPLIESEIAP